jgi:hypothetical protein
VWHLLQYRILLTVPTLHSFTFISSGAPLLHYRMIFTAIRSIFTAGIPLLHYRVIFNILYSLLVFPCIIGSHCLQYIHYWCTPALKGLTVYDIFTTGVPLYYRASVSTIYSVLLYPLHYRASLSITLYIYHWCSTAASYCTVLFTIVHSLLVSHCYIIGYFS